MRRAAAHPRGEPDYSLSTACWTFFGGAFGAGGASSSSAGALSTFAGFGGGGGGAGGGGRDARSAFAGRSSSSSASSSSFSFFDGGGAAFACSALNVGRFFGEHPFLKPAALNLYWT